MLALFDILGRRLGLGPREGRLLLLMGALVGTLLAAYTLAKVMRDALFLAEYGALALPYGYVAVAVASAFFVWLELRMARRFSRAGATRITQYLAMAASLGAAAAYPVARHATAAALYVWTGSQAIMLLPHFWVLALDIWDSRMARRVFPFLSGCGLLGGLAGGAVAGWLTPVVKRVGLLWILAGLFLLSHLLTRIVESVSPRRAPRGEMGSAGTEWQVFLRSRYVQLLAAGLALSVAVGTLVDFQFKFFVQKIFPDPHALTQFLGLFQAGLNALALLFQFGLAGWLLQRMGLAASTGLQPLTVLLFASWLAVSAGAWVVIAMRWIQGVVFQTLGKSSSEIYYSAIHPRERRRIKPAIDTLVDRWADALVGVLLIAVLRFMRVPFAAIAVITAVLAGVWLVVLFALNRQFGRAFEQALSTRWVEAETAAEWVRLPSSRKALMAALKSDDERRVMAALDLSVYTRDRGVRRAVPPALDHASPAVRAAAVRAMEAMRIAEAAPKVETMLDDPSDAVRRAAVSYLVAMTRKPAALMTRWLEGGDPALRSFALEAVLEHPDKAREYVTPAWVDARLASGEHDENVIGARAVAALDGKAARERIRRLLAHPDVDVRRAALVSAARQPSRELLDLLVPLLFDPDLSLEAHDAIVAVGDPAAGPLRAYVSGERGVREQSLAAHALADLATPRALTALSALVRSREVRQRHVGLAGLARARVRLGRSVLSQRLAHRLFLRELRDYRLWMEPARRLEGDDWPDVRLLGESMLESAEMSLARGLNALSCWYDPAPLRGAFERLRSRQPEVIGPALEYLGHVLPRGVFRPLERVFEEELAAELEPKAAGVVLEAAIRRAWEAGDSWLMAVALRATRRVPGFDRSSLEPGAGEDPLVEAEARALGESDRLERWMHNAAEARA